MTWQGGTIGEGDTPFWYTTKGVGLWVRTPLDFRYSVNEVVDGKKDGLLRVAMPFASALEYDLFVAKDVREVVRRFTREVGYPRRVPPAEYFRLPIYTTWVEHKADVTQAKAGAMSASDTRRRTVTRRASAKGRSSRRATESLTLVA